MNHGSLEKKALDAAKRPGESKDHSTASTLSPALTSSRTTPGTRTLDALAKRINAIHGQIITSVRTTLDAAISLGELLTRAKEQLAHGEWLPWLERSCEFDRSTAANYMRVFANRETIKCRTILHLTDAYALLSDTGDSKEEDTEEQPAPVSRAPDIVLEDPSPQADLELVKTPSDQRTAATSGASQDQTTTERSTRLAQEKLKKQPFLNSAYTRIQRVGGVELYEAILLREVQISVEGIYHLEKLPEYDLKNLAPQILAAGCFPLPKDQPLKEDITFEDDADAVGESSSTSAPTENEEVAQQRSPAAMASVDKIDNICCGLGLRDGLTTGRLAIIIDTDVIKWSLESHENIEGIASLVVKGWTFKEAFGFVNKVIDGKTRAEQLINYCVQAKGSFVTKISNFEFTVVNNDLLTPPSAKRKESPKEEECPALSVVARSYLSEHESPSGRTPTPHNK